MKVIDYWYAESDTVMNLAIAVRKRIDDGWTPVGGISHFSEPPRDRRYVQALVKYASIDSKSDDESKNEAVESKTIPMKLVINHTRRQEVYDLNETGSVYLDVRDANWLKFYKIGDEVRVCFEFEAPARLDFIKGQELSEEIQKATFSN